jgi:hypothetical protein
MSPQQTCSTTICHNSGACSIGWHRYLCDCALSGQIDGATCQDGNEWSMLNVNNECTESLRVTFESVGNQLVLLQLPYSIGSEAEDIQIKFRTPMRMLSFYNLR